MTSCLKQLVLSLWWMLWIFYPTVVQLQSKGLVLSDFLFIRAHIYYMNVEASSLTSPAWLCNMSSSIPSSHIPLPVKHPIS